MKTDTKIYVAGHHGLVGSAIVKQLKKKGYRNITGRTSAELDLRNASEVEAFFNKEKPEIVFLAAARVGGIIANNRYRGSFIYDNLMIQNNVIHQAYRSGVKKLLFLGSTCIYPKECPQPMKEEYLLTGPLEYTNEPYAIAKIAGIKLCESYNIQYGTNFMSVMPTNLYGPNDNFDLEKSHVLPALVRKTHLGKALENNDMDEIRKDLNRHPIEKVDGDSEKGKILEILEKYGIFKRAGKTSVEIWGSGKPRREFLWSEDMADACIFLVENLTFSDMYAACETEIRNTHLNIGTGQDISIRELAFLIKKITGFEGTFTFDQNKPDGTLQKLTDTTKLKKLGWTYTKGLEEGIRELYQFYKSE